MGGLCGTCTACCNAFNVPEIGHVAGKWCKHCDVGVGCKIYNSRPPTCVGFQCLWLNNYEEGPANLPIELRPDKCKVIFAPTTKPHIISAITMPNYPDAWRKPIVRWFISKLIEAGLSVVVGGPNTLRKTFIQKGG